MKYEDIIVHSTYSELRIALGLAITWRVDENDPDVIWMKMRGEDKELPHTTAARYAEQQIEDGDSGGSTPGAQGPMGPAGTQGLTGPQGAIGSQGATGEQGKPFTIKHQFASIEEMESAVDEYQEGDMVLIQTDESSEDNGKVYQLQDGQWKFVMDVQATAVIGPQGPKGEQGVQGIAGSNGIQGQIGITGSQGLTGIQGAIGPQGVAGKDGLPGAQGAIGATGAQGTKGEQGIQGATGAQGPIGPEDPTVVKYDPTHGIVLPNTASICAKRFNEEEEARVILCQRSYDEGVTAVTELGNSGNKLTLNASERPQIDLAGGSSEKIAYQSDIRNIPIPVEFPIRTSGGGDGPEDRVYEQSEIFEWFGVTDQESLNQLIANGGQMYLHYGISLQTRPYHYRIPIQYCAMESATQLKMVAVGLDTNDDSVCKYTIIANLNGTIIEGNSNVKCELTPIG